MRKLALFFLLICSMNAAAQRLGDVVDIQGVRGNQLVGYSPGCGA
ncbi:flagellar basal body P-ring protein [Citrobacter koseri]|nr:flagellar basal body P-ring protein [Citrobacter koseri]